MNVYPAYLNICRKATLSDLAFKNFRRHPAFHTVVEGVPVELGMQCASYIKNEYEYLLFYMDDFVTSDDVGRPLKYNYPSIGRTMSSVTLRYIKILGDLIKHFGTIRDMDIVEIGGGYGGQCKIIHDYLKPKSYTIIDLSEANALTSKFLRQFGIRDVQFKTPDSVLDEHYSLCISNYAFAEFDREYQDMYAEKVISESDNGYMICNFFDKYVIKERPDGMTREEISKLKPTGVVLPEEPQSIEGNFLYVWKQK